MDEAGLRALIDRVRSGEVSPDEGNSGEGSDS